MGSIVLDGVSLARHVAWFGLADLRVQRFGLLRMKCEDCGVVCALVLLLRLARFPPSGFAELVPLFRVNVWTLDEYVTGLCCDLRDPVEAFVLETVLDSQRGCVDWDAVAASRVRLFCHWCSVFQSLPAVSWHTSMHGPGARTKARIFGRQCAASHPRRCVVADKSRLRKT